MKNPHKRLLLSAGKPNKYSSGSKKRALTARPPQPASVSRLESILDEATNKKRKRRLEEKRRKPIPNNCKINGNIHVTRNILDPIRKESKSSSTATNRRRVSDEKTRNQAAEGTDENRWSHVNANFKSKHQGKAINPFLEMNHRKQAPQQTKTKYTESGVAKFDKPTKSVNDLSLALAKKDQRKRKKSKHRKEFQKEESGNIFLNVDENPIFRAEIISKEASESTTLINPNQMDVALDNAQNQPTTHNCTFHHTSQQSDSSSREEKFSNDLKNDQMLSGEGQVLTGNSASIQNENRGTLSESAFRPKLGLRLGKQKYKGKSDPSSISRFRSSRRVTSSPSDFHRTPLIADAGHESTEDDPLLVLRSPGKSTSCLALPQHSHENDDKPLLSNIGEASSAHFSLEKRNSIDDNTFREVSALRNDTVARQNASACTGMKKKRKNNNVNDNFVRLNMKNKAGACRGAKNKSSKYNKEKRTWTFRGGNASDGDGTSFRTTSIGSFGSSTLTLDPATPSGSLLFSDHNTKQHDDNVLGEGKGGRFSRYKASDRSKSNTTSYVSKMSGLDPLDEFVDGTFHPSVTKTKTTKPSSISTPPTTTVYGVSAIAEAPKCARHRRPCKLIKVKKATTGNKGREFYACSMPRGEQCDHFQWADDTVEAARCIIAKNSSYSSFITRQVAAYVDRFRALTVPELKEETSKRGLNKHGKKQQLLMRLAIWTRDELVKCSPQLAKEEVEGESEANNVKISSFLCQKALEGETSDCDSSCSSSSDYELELFDGSEESEQEGASDVYDEEMSNVRKERQVDDANSLSGSLREIFGHASFREGQEWAIKRCLEEKSSLLVAPTGFGKSLCYALPAALMDGVCIVVSPLISLIQDQLRSLPPRIPAATLSGSVSASKTAAIIDDIVRKRLKILFVSPERLTSPAFRRLFNPTWNSETKTRERKFPEISLLCIDEAHCISQWAHNFRPCFLRFKGFLKLMKPKSILAITATAGPRVIRDITQTLGMDIQENFADDSSNVPVDTDLGSIKIIRSGRDNIDVMGKFVSNQEERLSVVAGILTPGSDKSNPYAGKLARGSTIVYVWRQRDTEVVAESLKAAGVAGGIVVYHGGMDASARAKSQNKFMRGKARICVATVAFGLGIDKADIVGIVHLYLSNSPEHYLQEIGRAGRDGRSAIAIALPLLEEVPSRHSLTYSNLVAKSQIGALLRIIQRLVQSEAKICDMSNSNCGRFLHIALPVQSTVRACDCKPETIETFLSLIERIGGGSPLLQIEGYNYDGAAIAMKKRTLKKLAEREPIAASIEAVSHCVDAPLSEAGVGTEKLNTINLPVALTSSFQRQFLAYSKGSHSFSISQCANRLGPTAEPRHVFAALRRLQSSNELEFVLDTSEKGRIFQLKVSERGFQLLNGEEYSKTEKVLVDTIFESFSSSSDSGATKFLDMHYILDQVADASGVSTDIDACEESHSSDKSPSLLRFQELTGKYFGDGLESERLAANSLLPKSFSAIREKELKIDALSLLRDLPPLFQQYTNNHQDSKNDVLPEYLKLGDSPRIDYTALAITKFLHGMDTPRTPILTFRQYPLFGKWKTVHFRLVHDFILKVMKSLTPSVQKEKKSAGSEHGPIVESIVEL